MKTIPRGLFLVLSGPEGGGKSTQAHALAEKLRDDGYETMVTAGFARKLKDQAALNDASGLSSWQELLKYSFERSVHIDTVILPALSLGSIVICDRFIPDTYAYLCVARSGTERVERQDFWYIMGRSMGNLHIPQMTFWFDVGAKIGLSRKHKQEETVRFSSAGLDFHERVAVGFQEFFADHGEYAHVRIDAEKPKDEILGVLVEETYRLIMQYAARSTDGPITP